MNAEWCENLLIKIPFLFPLYTSQHTPQTIRVKWLQILCFHFNSSNVFACSTEKAFDEKIENWRGKKLSRFTACESGEFLYVINVIYALRSSMVWKVPNLCFAHTVFQHSLCVRCYCYLFHVGLPLFEHHYYFFYEFHFIGGKNCEL